MNLDKYKDLFAEIEAMPLAERVTALNEVRLRLHELSPFRSEPVDCVLWVPCDDVVANDYNPNKVAPPEMELLEVSILNDGYTQPIVTWQNRDKDKIEVIDGFHRNRVGKESKLVRKRIHGYLPTVVIREEQNGKNDRIASTIRHNRARGKHLVSAMSEIVIELKNRNWTNERIAKELGMDYDEILRLCQISGLESLFKDDDFSRSWNIEDTELSVGDFEPLTDEVTEEERERERYRTVNTGDENRVFHTFDKWECYAAGFYASRVEGKNKEQCEREYGAFLADLGAFRAGLEGVTTKWVHSCEHYLTNKAMNRIAWLGQAACCYSLGIPQEFRGGYQLLTDAQKHAANVLALEYLNKWLVEHGGQPVELEEAMLVDKQISLY